MIHFSGFSSSIIGQSMVKLGLPDKKRGRCRFDGRNLQIKDCKLNVYIGVCQNLVHSGIFFCVNLPDENAEVEAGSRMRTTIVGVFHSFFWKTQGSKV